MVGINIKNTRKACGLSVETLSEMTGLSKSQIWSYESGRREPPIDSLVLLADAFKVSLDTLIRGKEKKPSPVDREQLQNTVGDAFANLPQDQQDLALAVYSAVINALQSPQK